MKPSRCPLDRPCPTTNLEGGEMNHERTTISIALATLMLLSLFAVVNSAMSVSGQTMAGTGPAVASSNAQPPFPTGDNEYANYFAVDTGSTVWHTNGSGNWDSLGGVATSSPATVSWDSSYLRLDVFVRGSNGALYWKVLQNGWSGWKSPRRTTRIRHRPRGCFMVSRSSRRFCGRYERRLVS